MCRIHVNLFHRDSRVQLPIIGLSNAKVTQNAEGHAANGVRWKVEAKAKTSFSRQPRINW